ncbi:MAG: UvrD-helicase domain-containing protein, partial [Clostridia bacterium]|nr:UvrD-helicase domain-containing protein [Clostridia bacterium]
MELKEKATKIRDTLKKQFKTYLKAITEKSIDLKRLPEICKTTDYLVQLVKEYGNIYAELKAEENVLDFNDLEHFAYRVLLDDNVKTAVREKYKFVFVDEYQDTNGVQEEIITAVSNDNLFMVGDVKQSIYGFRGCNPDIFSNKMKTMKHLGKKTAMLNYNFRSAEKVIDKVNEIFTYCMKKDNFGEDYSLNSMLKPGGIYGENNLGRATVHLLVKPEKKTVAKETPRVYDILSEIKNEENKKASSISSLVTEIIREELGKTYYHPKEKTQKIVTFNDIVILTRNRSNEYVESLVDGLKRHGINVVSEVSQDVCAYPEIQVLINALRLIDCYKNDIPLATVLKSPIGGFSEEELAKIVIFSTDNKGKNGFYDAYNYYLENAQGELYNRLKAFDEYVKELRYLADFIGAKGVLQKILDDSMYLTFILAEKHGELKLKRIRKFMELTENSGILKTVSEVLDNIDNAKDAYKTSFNADEDAVRVMTIHASKGLEFPVVIVCGLERKMNAGEEREEVLLNRECGFALKYYDQNQKTYSETLLRSFIRQKMKAERVKEEMRLFYVATTRASYSLHLTFEGEYQRSEEFSSADKMLDYLPPNISVNARLPEEFSFTDLTKEQKQVIIGKPDLDIS